jgi:hypothetical protein
MEAQRCGCVLTYYELGADQLTCADHSVRPAPPAPQETPK